jgi:hypothetical protein
MATQQTVLSYLDGYCERAGDPSLWGEPLNAVTNLCFIVAAILAARQLRNATPVFKVDLWLLVAFLFAIGLGSGAWHLQPTQHTVLMDVIPITLFINAYLISALRRFLKFSWGKTLFWWAIYFVAGLVAQKLLPPDTLNGTIMYIPTFITLGVLTLAVRARDAAMGAVFGKVVGVWALSLTFRTIDPLVCEAFPYGTHFLWHALNAWVLWRLLVVLIAYAQRASMATASYAWPDQPR